VIKIKVIINTKCPYCKKDIEMSTNTPDNFVEDNQTKFYDIARQSSLEAAKNTKHDDNAFFNDVMHLLLKNQKKEPKCLVKEYFNHLDLEIDTTKDKKELKKIKSKLSKSKLRVSKQVSDEFKKNKEKLLKKVEQKLNKLKKQLEVSK
jgi:hypothetical protein